MTRRTLPAPAVVGGAALWMAAAGNLPLWRKLHALQLLDGPRGALFALALLLMLWAALAALLSLFAWRRALEPAIALLLVMTALASHFMSSYGVVVDPGMVTNVLQTDVHEAGALLSGSLITTLLWMAALPIAWLSRQPVRYHRAGRPDGDHRHFRGLPGGQDHGRTDRAFECWWRWGWPALSRWPR